MAATRREFIEAAALIGAGVWSSRSAAAPRFENRLRFACIGVGGKGSSDADNVAELGDIVAICDVDDRKLTEKQEKNKKFQKAERFNDFRKMLEMLGSSIDAVTVSTPDHTHAPASLMAMRMGKHVYCQKPLTRTVYEARLMRTTAKEKNVCTQMGNQGTAEDGLRQAVEIIQSGAIGPVKTIHVWTNRPVWNQAPDVTSRPANVDPVPKYLHWQEWLGPAPFRPYAGERVYHDFNWRGWWEFGTGAMGDMACHTANMAFMACKLFETFPTKVKAESGKINAETFPEWGRITYEYPARGDMPPCTLIWYEGREGGRHNRKGKKVLPPDDLLKQVLKPGERLADSGSLIVGEKGMLFSPDDYGAAFRLLPADRFKDYQPPSPTLPRNGKRDLGMKQELVEAIKANKPSVALSNFDYAAAFTENMLVGNIALRLGKELIWDGPNMKATNCAEADQFIKQETRAGWTV